MRVLDRNISENTEKMLHRLFSDKETSLPVEYEYTPEETSSVTFLGDKYIIKLQKSISDQLVFEDTLLHEYAFIDNISSYISSPRNSDTIELLYSELKGIISKHFIG